MINTVCEKDMCTGCTACVNICPKNCIQLVDNIKSFDAVINKDLCINCNLCKNVCQVNNIDNPLIQLNKVLECKEGKTKSDEINKLSASGGFATTLGIEFIKNGGYVVGIRNDLDEFKFDITNNTEEVLKFAGSKYVKVIPNSIFKSIKEKLNQNDKVLFIGLPCQIAGLKLYLQKEYDNLYTIDLICHGTPSMKVLMKYLNEIGYSNTKGLSFRDKQDFKLFINKKPLINKDIKDPYTVGFIQGLFYTNNCYSCKFAKENRIGDITIGDSWGSNSDMKNSSLVLKNTLKGDYLLSLIKDYFTLIDGDFETIKKNNHQLNHASLKQDYTDYYFDHFNDKITYKIIKKAYPKIVLKQKIRHILIKLHLKK